MTTVPERIERVETIHTTTGSSLRVTTVRTITLSTPLSADGVREWLGRQDGGKYSGDYWAPAELHLSGEFYLHVYRSGKVSLWHGGSLCTAHITTVGDLVNLVRGLTGREMEVDG